MPTVSVCGKQNKAEVLYFVNGLKDTFNSVLQVNITVVLNAQKYLIVKLI